MVAFRGTDLETDELGLAGKFGWEPPAALAFDVFKRADFAHVGSGRHLRFGGIPALMYASIETTLCSEASLLL